MKRIRKCLFFCILLAAFVSLVVLARTYYTQYKAARLYEQMQESIVEATPVPVSVTPTPAAQEPAEEEAEEEVAEVLYEAEMYRRIDFADLQENTNADIYAWIYIPDTVIDYPVLQHATDDTYYLNYNIDGSKGYPGCIYSEMANAKDFSDFLTVLYGHNMKNGTMFNGLHQFEDAAFFEEHPYIYIYCADGRTLRYQIFAAYKHSDEHLLKSYTFLNSFAKQSYIDSVLEQKNMVCNLREDVEVTPESNILTLSTCVSGESSKRYLVQAVFIDDVTFDISQLQGSTEEETNAEEE